MRLRLWVVVVIALSSIAGAPISPGVTAWENISALLLARVAANSAGAQREKTLPAQILKSVSGVSELDIERYDWKRGPGSIINRPFGTLGPLIGIDWKPPWAPTPLEP